MDRKTLRRECGRHSNKASKHRKVARDTTHDRCRRQNKTATHQASGTVHFEAQENGRKKNTNHICSINDSGREGCWVIFLESSATERQPTSTLLLVVFSTTNSNVDQVAGRETSDEPFWAAVNRGVSRCVEPRREPVRTYIRRFPRCLTFTRCHHTGGLPCDKCGTTRTKLDRTRTTSRETEDSTNHLAWSPCIASR